MAVATKALQHPSPRSPLAAPARLWRYLGERKDTPFQPFPAQAEILSTVRVPWPGDVLRSAHPRTLTGTTSQVPYPTVFSLECGRRFSKTTILEKILWNGLLAPDDTFGPPTVRVTADTEEHGRKVWDRFLRHLYGTPLHELLDSHSRERELVTLHTGATAQLISANNPNALAGDGVSLWIIDEAQYLTQEAWDNLFPSTAERNGVILLAGVCEGSGPFKTICAWGRSPDKPEFHTLSYPTAANPYVPAWRIDFARRTLAPSKFAQLYLARWTDAVGKLFRNIEGCILPGEWSEHPTGFFYTQPPGLPGRDYVAGLDLGRLSDWTVHSIWRPDGELVAWDRFAIIDWELQKARIAQVSALYGYPTTMVDATGVGDPVFEDLSRKKMAVVPYEITSNVKKRVLVDELALRVGAGLVHFPRIPELVDELGVFEAKKASETSNVIVYSAPSGLHDDWVLSAALATQLLPRNSPETSTDPEAQERQTGPWEAI